MCPARSDAKYLGSSSPVAVIPNLLTTTRPQRAMSSTAESSTLTVVERVQSFVSEHKKALIVGAAVAVAAGGAVYYAASSSSRKPRPKEKKKSKSKKKKTTKDVDGPLLEEIQRNQEQLDDEAFAGEYQVWFVVNVILTFSQSS